MTTQTNSKSNLLRGILNFLKLIFAISFILSGIIIIFNGSFIGAIFLILAGILLIPTISNKLQRIFSFWEQRIVRLVLTIGIVLIGIVISGIQNGRIKQGAKHIEKQKTVEVKTPNYEILEATTIRVDGAKSYFVLIDRIDLSNEKFKTDIKLIIDKIVRERDSKLNIEILDDKKALETMYKSHYGENTLGRILNKKEMKLLENHFIASFSGELDTMLYFNQLDFFPAMSKNKHSDSIEYNPNKK